MSRYNTVYDFLISEMGTLFPSKTRIPNPYVYTDNSISFMRDSWGIRAGGHIQTGGELHNLTQRYDFILSFVREVIRLDHSTGDFVAVEKALENDITTARKHFYDTDTTSSVASDLDILDLGPTSAPVQLFFNKNHFLVQETTLITRIRETY